MACRRRPAPAPPDGPAVYLLHLDAPIAGHAAHFLGEAASLARRLREHRRGRGARLLAHARRLGIAWRLVRWWPASSDDGQRLNLERRLKNRHGPVLCPVCNPRAKRNGRPERVRVAAVKWPRPRRFGRYLGPGETGDGRGGAAAARPRVIPSPTRPLGSGPDDP
jgi:hypothetical protein